MLPNYITQLFEENLVKLPLPKFTIIKGIEGYESQEEVNKLSLIQERMEEVGRDFFNLLEKEKYREATWKLRKEGREAIMKFGRITDALIKFYDEIKKDDIKNLSTWLQIFAYGYVNYLYPFDNLFQYFESTKISPYAFVENEMRDLLKKYDEQVDINNLKTIISPSTEIFTIVPEGENVENLGIRVYDFNSSSELREGRKRKLLDYISSYPDELYVRSIENASSANEEFARIYRKMREKSPEDASNFFYGMSFLREREAQEEEWELYGHKAVSIFIVRNKITSQIAEALEKSTYREKLRNVYGNLEYREKERTADVAYDWVDILYLLQELNL
jgi:hypothetical protein